MKKAQPKARAVAIIQVQTSNMLEHEAAAYLRVSVRTLQAWRAKGKGPRFADYGVITYAVQDLDDFRDRHLRISTSDLKEDGAAESGSSTL